MESPKLSPEDAAAVALMLRHYMSFLSEEKWAAGWQTDWEYTLWCQVQSGVGREADVLRRLARLCGGWWVWRKDDDGEAPGDDPYGRNLKFVPLDEWITYFDQSTNLRIMQIKAALFWNNPGDGNPADGGGSAPNDEKGSE
jgi:hypothetical protein